MVIAASCSNETVETTSQSDTTITSAEKDTLTAMDTSYVIPSESPDTITHISFPELTVLIDRLVVWEEDEDLLNLRVDSITITAELGETPEGQKIRLISRKLTEMKIWQSFETSVTISGEGPHCDLTEWKHYHSAWKELKREGDAFLTLIYPVKESERFPEIEISELKEAIGKECGEQWLQWAKDIRSPHDPPASVGISRYFIRITGVDKATGETVEKIIAIVSPMGC